MGMQVTELCLSEDELECLGQKHGQGENVALALSALMVGVHYFRLASFSKVA